MLAAVTGAVVLHLVALDGFYVCVCESLVLRIVFVFVRPLKPVGAGFQMTPRDIKLHIERKLASFEQSARTPPQSAEVASVSPSGPTAADTADWQYRLPAPPTPFQDPASGRAAPLEAPLEFQDNMTVTSSEPSETGELAEATNRPLVERVGRSDPAPPLADQSEPAPPPADQSEPAPPSADQSEPAPASSGRSERPAKPQRRRSSERLSRQMSFSIGAYGQRETAAAESGGSGGRPQRADSFHCQKTAAATTGQVRPLRPRQPPQDR